MFESIVAIVCIGCAVMLFMVLLTLGLCRAAGKTDEYLEKWEAEHERHHQN